VCAGWSTDRGAGLSGSKTASLLDLAAKVDDGAVRLDRIGRLSDREVVEHLVAVRGIGPWTADMFLIFTLGRRDVWPVGDYGVRVGYSRAYGLAEVPSAKELEPLGDRFRPYRTLAAWYCWRVAGTEQPV
jgi:DNA-3-methyladenine glycosylase II